MGTLPQLTTPVVKVLSALLADPDAERYGLELMHATGLASGTLYPILLRLAEAGWVEPRWEQADPATEGRPSRRYYRLTADGVLRARHELAALHQHLSQATGISGRVSPA